MPPILLATFTNEEGVTTWRAFSSTDEHRTSFHLNKETLYFIGYQESHPGDRITYFGLIGNYYIRQCDITLEYRAMGIRLILTPDNELNGEFPFLTATENYNQVIPEGHTIAVIPHTFIDPNPFYTAMSDSDSDSD